MARSAEGGVERVMTGVPNASPAGAAVGAPDRVIAIPASTAEVRDIIRSAIERRAGLRLVGRGTWLAAGRPVIAAETVPLDGLIGIVDYTPGDLTLTARAGTTLAEIRAATAAEGQWLALTPWGGDSGSLGATIATATDGPTGGSLGTPRDIVIGLEVVTGAGEVVRGGGRVVKNVAGFDLTRLMVGAWGTLGAITEVSVRLRAMPEHDLTLAIPAPATAPALADLLVKLRGAPVAPLALELVSATVARHLALGDGPLLLARIAGNADLVTAQRSALETFGAVTDPESDVWSRLRTIEPADATVLRLSGPIARFAQTWATAERIVSLASGAFAHASVLRSVTRVILPQLDGALPDSVIAAIRAESRDTRIFERLPSTLWASLAPSAVADRLSQRVRAAFDPHRLLNPGILGEPTA